MNAPLKTSLSLLLGLAVLAGPAAASELREWSVTRGANIKAEFVELKGDKVVLRTDEGELTEIPLLQLSGSDQTYARKMAMSKPAGKAGAASGPANVLPAIVDGPWKGAYAYYETPKMDVVISTNGFATIYLKDQGKRIGAALPTGWGIRYSDGTTPNGKPRPVVYYEDPAPPGPIKGRLVCKGMAQDKTKFETEFIVENNSLDLGVGFSEPANIKYKGNLKFYMTIPRSHNFPEATPLDQMIKALVGYTLSYTPVKGPRVELKFHEVTTLASLIDSATVKGPWGPRVLTITQPRGGATYITSYASTQVWRGFGVRKHLKSEQRSTPIRITVE